MSLTSHYSARRRGAVAISDEEIRSLAPSVFASQPIEGVSERYSFLPTSSILRGMRETGWVPVRAIEQRFALKPVAAFKNTLSGLLGLNIFRPGKRTKFDQRSFWLIATIKAALISFIAGCFGWCALTASSFPMALSSASPLNISDSIRTRLSKLLWICSTLSLTS